MKLKSFGVLFVVLIVGSISLLLVSVVVAKPVGKNPATAWVPGTLWGTKLRLQNENYIWDTYFGVGTSQIKIGSPPDPPDALVVEFFDGENNWFEWVKVAADHENWPIRMRSVGAAPSSATLSSVMENADTWFVPQDFSVVLENSTLGLNVNLRKENKLITGLPMLATLYLDNAVNVTISPDSQTGNPGDTVDFTVTVNNSGRYPDNYSLVVDADNLSYTISPSTLSINAGSSATATLTVTVGADGKVITVSADGTYADDDASCAVNEYTLTTSVDPTNSGSVTLDPTGGTYTSGTDVTATATPASGYEFDHWSGDASGTAASLAITMDSDKNIVAHFRTTEQQYTLTTSVDPTSSGSVSPVSGTYVSGDNVTVTAYPASGYEFDQWSSDTVAIQNPTDNSITIPMNSDENIVAHFKSASRGASGGLPWTWIVVGVIIVVILIVAASATIRTRRARVPAR